MLPRTDLTDRFVVIERKAKDHTRKHIVANPESVRLWLNFLFANHPEFIRRKNNGDLEHSSQTLSELQSQSELGEVLEDVEYVSDTDAEGDGSAHSKVPEGTSSFSGLIQPELQSGFSFNAVFTFDKYPNLYLKAKDFLRIKQGGQIQIIQDH